MLKWSFSPWRLRGHRERLHLSRHALAVRVEKSADTIKAYEWGVIKPSTDALLSLAGSLGISPDDLCRASETDTPADPTFEYLAGRTWPDPPSPPTKPEDT